MDVTFFAEKEGCDLNSFEELQEHSILGGGRFTKNQISDLLSCFKCSPSTLSDNFWIFPTNFSEELATIDDEKLKEMAVHSMDLAGHLFELKYAYLSH